MADSMQFSPPFRRQTAEAAFFHACRDFFDEDMQDILQEFWRQNVGKPLSAEPGGHCY